MADEKVIEKIKKCLALAKSGNSHEAAIAFRHAQALMRTYGLTEKSVELSNVKSVYAKAGWGKEPPKYFGVLLCLIKHAFGVDAVFHVKHSVTEFFEYIVLNCSVELAAYAHGVLRRQLRKDRADYMKSLVRYKRENNSRKADLFAEQWVASARSNVLSLAHTEEYRLLIAEYKTHRFEKLELSVPRAHEFNRRDNDAWLAGVIAGRNVKIHWATGFDAREQLEFGSAS